MTVTMYDAVAYGNIPHDPAAVAGYISGPNNYDALVRTFPEAHHISIATGSEYTAQILDVETFDATPEEAGPWLDRMFAAGVQYPGVYANHSTYSANLGYLERYGSKIRRWVADWTFEEHIPLGYDACQWSGGQILDISACLDTFFVPLADRDPNHIDWFMDEVYDLGKLGKHNERKTVEHYDAARNHPLKHRKYLKHELEPVLHALAKRVADAALLEEKSGKLVKRAKPEWDKDKRGWRYQQLHKRAEGKHVSK